MQRRNFLIAAGAAALAVPFAARRSSVSAQNENASYRILEAVALECSRLSGLMSEHGVWDGLNRERGLSLAHSIRIASLIMVEYDHLLGAAAARTLGGEGAFLVDVVVNGQQHLQGEQPGFETGAPAMSLSAVRSTFADLQNNGVSGTFDEAASGLIRYCDEDPELMAYCRRLANDRDEAQVAAGIVCAAALLDPTPILKTACAVAMAHAAALTLLYRIQCGHL
ncbi:MAG: hypothetical protein OXG04_02995 [Acidobacteria bacterium]|nr:hypothetical protein [Acidobacteriota bacterium]